jgi:HK97 family phage major capsid protein
MTKIELQQERAKFVEQMRALNAKNRNLSADDQKEWDRLKREADALTARIQRQETLDSPDYDIDRTDPRARAIDPLRSAHGGDNPLLSRGGESRTPEQREQSEAFRRYLLTGQRNGDLQTRELGTGAGSGVLVPLHISSQIIQDVEALSNVRRPRAAGIPGASVMQIEGNTDIPAIGDATALRLSESDTDDGGIVETDVTIGDVNLRPNLTVCRVDVKVHLLNRSAPSIEQELVRSFARSIAKLEQSEFYSGTGTDEPEGLLTVAAAETAASETTFTDEELENLFFTMGPEFLNDSVWLASPTAYKIISAMEDGASHRLFSPDRVDGIPRVYGRPVLLDGAMPAVATSAKPLALVNLREGYLIGEEVQFTVMVDPYTRADSAEVRIFASRFNDGRVRRAAAITDLAMDAGE